MSSKRVSSAEAISSQIIDDIFCGRLVPGQRLVESTLTESFGVSRGPVREAFRRLDALGVIEGNAYRGVGIKKLTRTEALHLIEAVTPTACYIAKLAAKAVSRSDSTDGLNEYKEMLGPYLENVTSIKSELLSRKHFYNVLIQIGGNSQLNTVLPTLRIQLLRLQTFSYSNEIEIQAHHDNYKGVALAVLDGNTSSAEKIMLKHMKYLMSMLKDFPDIAYK